VISSSWDLQCPYSSQEGFWFTDRTFNSNTSCRKTRHSSQSSSRRRHDDDVKALAGTKGWLSTGFWRTSSRGKNHFIIGHSCAMRRTTAWKFTMLFTHDIRVPNYRRKFRQIFEEIINRAFLPDKIICKDRDNFFFFNVFHTCKDVINISCIKICVNNNT